ncbi:MAG: hypothetical protein ACR2OZ_01600 [Verrucomicrobiales bacterium]
MAGNPIAQQAYLKASNTGADDRFGIAAISGDTVVVGAYREDSNATGVNGNQSDNTAADSGAAYVFVRNGTTWTQQAYLKASNTGAGDWFGYSVAVAGDTVVIGAASEGSNATGANGNQDDNSAPGSGAAYVFTRSGTTWTQQAYLKASNTGAGDIFGQSVAVSGDTLVVGAYNEDSSALGVNGSQLNNNAPDSGAAYVFLRSGTTWTQQAFLKASNTGAADAFGFSVALSGDTAVVGAPWEDSRAFGVNHAAQSDNSAAESGAAYVFVRSGTTWSQQAYLKASNTGDDDQFGYSVAVSGDTVLIGAIHERSSAIGVNGDQSNNSAFFAGAAYVFVRSGATWAQQAYLKASNTASGARFGSSVAVSGGAVIVGAVFESSDTYEAGAAYLFLRSGTAWSQHAHLKASNAGGNFGTSVAISDGSVIVGAIHESSNATGVNGNQGDASAQSAGAAYVFTGVELAAQLAYLKASNTGANDFFGVTVAVSGDIVVVGASAEDSNAIGVNGNQSNNSAPDSGAAYVFVRNGTSWRQQAYLKASNTGAGDAFGSSVAVSGDIVVIGARYEDSRAFGVNHIAQNDNNAADSGAAYVFVRSGTTWSQQAYLKASNTGEGDSFGSVAVSGETVVIGAFAEDSSAIGVNGDQSDNSAAGAGGAYIFVRTETTWSQQAYLKASNTGGGDFFGGSVAISDNTVVVGAYPEASNATGVNGNQNDNSALYSGAAYVFVRNETTWSQQAYLKASNTEAYDFFGASVAVSGDTVVVGAYTEDSSAVGVNGSQSNNSAANSGAAYVFVRNGSTWEQQAYLKASNTEAGDSFGYDVALSENTVVVGAISEASATTGVNGQQSDNSAEVAGAAYVFVRSGTTWIQHSYLKASNTGAHDDFGRSVAIAGNTVIAGAAGEDSVAITINGNQNDNTTLGSGAAYVFIVAEQTAFEIWRLQHFGSPADSGEGADLADIDADGMTNLLEFATGENPRQPGAIPIASAITPSVIEFTYTRNKAALGEIEFAAEWTDSLPALSWSAAGVIETILSGDGSVQQIMAAVPLGTGNRRFVRLRVSSNQ